MSNELDVQNEWEENSKRNTHGGQSRSWSVEQGGKKKNWHTEFEHFPLTGGCSEGLDAFRFFFKH